MGLEEKSPRRRRRRLSPWEAGGGRRRCAPGKRQELSVAARRLPRHALRRSADPTGVQSTCHLGSRPTWDPLLHQPSRSVHGLGASADTPKSLGVDPLSTMLGAGSGGSVVASFPSCLAPPNELRPRCHVHAASALRPSLTSHRAPLAFPSKDSTSALFLLSPSPSPGFGFVASRLAPCQPPGHFQTSRPSSFFPLLQDKRQTPRRSLKLLLPPGPQASSSSAPKKCTKIPEEVRAREGVRVASVWARK